jgi:hypothetical protein
MAIFVNYDGPKLDTEQKRVVRSRAMVVVRGRRKQAKCQAKSSPDLSSRLLQTARKIRSMKKGGVHRGEQHLIK